MTEAARPRPTFRLIELLVVMGVLTVILGLIIPAIVSMNPPINRSLCINHLKMIGLAIHDYSVSHNALPSGRTNGTAPFSGRGFGALPVLLPFIESDKFYNQINFGIDLDSSNSRIVNITARSAGDASLWCPSDPVVSQPRNDGIHASNYAFNAGTRRAMIDNNGVMFEGSAVRLSDITDGTANTALASETTVSRGSRPRASAGWIVETEPGGMPEGGPGCGQVTGTLIPVRGWDWFVGAPAQTLYTHHRPPNPPTPDCRDGSRAGDVAARSRHGDVVLLLLADGSVRFVRETVNPAVWQALGTRAGGETIPPSSY